MKPATTELPGRVAGSVRGRPGWTVVVLAVTGLVALPVLVVVSEGLTPSVSVWKNLLQGSLGEMVVTTLVLLAGVGLGSLVLGAGLAWLVTAYRFPGVELFRWILVLPLAMPAYVLGFVFLALFDFPGPVQTTLRAVFGPDVWFPDVRSVGGAAAVLSLTLYPYVYLLARAALREHAPSTFEAARLLGDGRLRAAVRVVMPLARPSLAAGLLVAMMETLTDFATVQYFNVQTVSVGVYRVWRGAFDRQAAFELAALVLVFALMVVVAERLLRGGRSYEQRGRGREFEQVELKGSRAVSAVGACLVVLTLGFLLPVAQLAVWAVGSRGEGVRIGQGLEYAGNSLTVALAVGGVAVVVAVLLAGGARLAGGRLAARAARLAVAGYAVPGPVVAIGVLGLVIGAARLAERIGVASPGTLVALSLLGLVYAYVVRFMALAYGPVDASLEKVTPSIVDAAHTLGAGPGRVLRQVYLPMVRAGAGAGAVLVAIDALKELPIVLFIRPFGFTTLSVWVWQLASESRWSQAALPAMLIVLVAAIPVLIHIRRARRERSLLWVAPGID